MANTSPPEPANARLPFETLGGYQLLSKIGGGGMGSVYLARHLLLNRVVALKMLAASRHDDPIAVARFRQEMEAIGRLKHPHIIAATDAGEEKGCHYLVMEYVEGVDLGRLLRSVGPLPISDACELARQTAIALVCIEEHGLVHRDIKPSNLLLGRDGILRILDLGLARLHEPSADCEALTDSFQVMGTGDFIAPEQGQASHFVDIRADIYSLGCTLYALLTGRAPFAEQLHGNFYLKVRAHIEEPVPPILLRRPDVPAGLVDLLGRMLAKDPAVRLAAPAEVARLLAPFATDHDLVALPAKLRIELTTTNSNASPELSTRPRRPKTEQDSDHVIPPSAARQGSRWVWAGVCLGLLIAGFTIWLAIGGAWPFTRPTNPDLNPSAGPSKTAIFEPGISYDPLEHRPRVLLWPKDPKNSRWDHDPEKRELSIHCDGLCAIELADVVGEGFDLDMTLVQTPWAGGVGVFFRGRNEPADLKAGTWADLLVVEHFSENKKPQTARLSLGRLARSTPEQRPFPHLFNSQIIAWPARSGHRLKLAVGSTGLQSVSSDDQAVADSFCNPQPQTVPRTGAGGSVGVFVQSSSVLVRSVRFQLHPSRGK
jgi:serine/threonine protein kinase